MPQRSTPISGLSATALQILAMALMLCDHLWATVVPGNGWLTWLGRLAYPIFAFLLVEGYFHTQDLNKYLKRLLVFALISEIPFNLMYTGLWLFPFHQNVLWTFLLSLLCLRRVEKIRARFSPAIALVLSALAAGGYALAAQFAMTDYYGYGVITVLVFYFFRGQRWNHRLGQLLGLLYINWYGIRGLTVDLPLFGAALSIPQQGAAILALLPIWCCQNRQGPGSKALQYFRYAFYPAHMLLLGLLSSL